VRRVWILRWTVIILLLCVPVALAVVSGSVQEHLESGYTRLIQARLAPAGVARERLLSAAIADFREAYDLAGAIARAHVLVGAAQAYLLMQAPRRVFPFLWQATPLQRAEKSLQQALFLHTDNAAAALLLGMVYWRQAAAATGPQADTLARSRRYLAQAAALGIPVRLPPAATADAGIAHTFGVEDDLLLLQYVDARDSGRADDLILLYRPAESPRVFGVVVTAGQAHALTTHATTGVLAPTGLLEAITVTPQPGRTPLLTLRFSQDAQPVDLRFTWDGTRFVPLTALP
jgi:hypothetical protein